MKLIYGDQSLDLSQPRIMGVLNRTPDSFSDGGHFLDLDAALAQAERLLKEGADIIDVGGESTRPGAGEVTLTEELDRVIPVIEKLWTSFRALISVDTCKPEVMRAAIGAGAAMVNDVCALRRPGAVEIIAGSGAAVCLMHMQGEPRTMQKDPQYKDVVAEVCTFLKERAATVRTVGVAPERIVLDPGFGFGKNLEHNLSLLRGLQDVAALGHPVLVGLSRKSMIGALTGAKSMDGRLHGSVSAAVLAVQNGAHIVRVHDVAPTVEALKVAQAVGTALPD